MLVKKMFLVAVFLIPLCVNAGEASNISKIDLMTVGANYVRVQLESMKNVEGCSNQTKYLLDINGGQHKEMYSALLAAQAQQQDVSVMLTGCHSSLNYPLISHVYLR